MKIKDLEDKILNKYCICYVGTLFLNIERKIEQKKGAQ